MASLDIAICTYNNNETLPPVLEAVEALHGAFDLRLLICDNESEDETLALLNRWQQRIPITVIQSGSNAGFAAAINRCLELRRPATPVLVLNPDVVLGPAADMERLLEALTRDRVGVVTPLLETSPGHVDHACARPEPTVLQTLVYALHLTTLAARLSPRRHWYGKVPPRSAFVDSCSGAFMLLRPEALDAVGGFDQRFWMYAEDLDLCRRLRESGYRIWFERDLVATHSKGGSTAGSWSVPTQYWFFESMRLYYAKWYGATTAGRLGMAPLSLLSRAWSWAVSRRADKSSRPW